jgi:FAD/FMN-containing dehydrogenase
MTVTETPTTPSAIDPPPRFGGEWIVPGDPEYDELRWINDERYDRRPAAIARPRGVADVQAIVRSARAAGVPLTVRSGGHGFSGYALEDGAVMIDMRLMDDIHVDLAKRSVRIRPGALGGNVIRETAPHGLSPVTGMAGDIGYGGIGAVGGFGYRSPRYGTTCGNLLSIEMVLADGSWVTASPVANPDLFWAARGAGDNFGVVTAFEAMLHPIPPDADVLTLLWDPDDAEAALRKFYELEPDLSEDYYWSLDAFFYEPGKCGVGISSFHLGGPGVREAEMELLTGLAELGTVVHQEVNRIPYEDMYYLPLHGANWFDTKRAYIGAACLRDPNDDATLSMFISHAQELASCAGDPAKELRLLALYPMNKGLSRPAVPPTSQPPRSGLLLLPIAYYYDPADDLGHEQWSDALCRAYVDAGLTIGAHNAHIIHAVSNPTRQAVADSFGENYERLLELKARWDPDGVFRGTLSAP